MVKNFTGCDNYRHLAEKIEKISAAEGALSGIRGIMGLELLKDFRVC